MDTVKKYSWIKYLINNFYIARLFYKGLSSLRREGIKTAWLRVKLYFRKKRHVRLLKSNNPYKLDSGTKIPGIKPPEAVHPHTDTVDIIICVHNAHDDVKSCLESVVRCTSAPYQIILVDDGSDPKTENLLKEFSQSNQNTKLIRNPKALGYTYAANIGMKASSANYIVLLNSDTLVTIGWLDGMIHCQQSGEKIGIVGPLSNTASWQSVPLVHEDGDWALNKLPIEYDLEHYSKLIKNNAAQIYPNLPLINGFCMLIHRTVFDTIGYFDEENFGSGFAEENDFCLRASKAGFAFALADNVYVYHAQSRSYTDEKRKILCEQNDLRLRNKHSDVLLERCVDILRDNFILAGIRARVAVMCERDKLINEGKKRWAGKRVLFLLPAQHAGGGGNIIIQEANVMLRMGVDVRLYNLNENKDIFEASHPDLHIPIVYGERFESIKDIIKNYDLVCATLYKTVENCDFNKIDNAPKTAYYIQDFEPLFFNTTDEGYSIALRSYTAVPSMKLVTKTLWNQKIIMKKVGVSPHIIGKSVDINLYRPRRLFPRAEGVVIAAMVRPHSSRRSPELTLEVLNRILVAFGPQVQIYIFGSDPEIDAHDRLFWDKNKKHEKIANLGLLNKLEMAALLSHTDIFIDFSSYQAMGLTTMEAMASGCCVIGPQNGGTAEFIENGVNGILVDTSDPNACYNALINLINDNSNMCRMAYRALQDMCKYHPENCAYEFLHACFK